VGLSGSLALSFRSFFKFLSCPVVNFLLIVEPSEPVMSSALLGSALRSFYISQIAGRSLIKILQKVITLCNQQHYFDIHFFIKVRHRILESTNSFFIPALLVIRFAQCHGCSPRNVGIGIASLQQFKGVGGSTIILFTQEQPPACIQRFGRPLSTGIIFSHLQKVRSCLLA